MRPLKAIQVAICNNIANPLVSPPLQVEAHLVMNTDSGCLERQQTEHDCHKKLPEFDHTIFQPCLLEKLISPENCTGPENSTALQDLGFDGASCKNPF